MVLLADEVGSKVWTLLSHVTLIYRDPIGIKSDIT